jgi:hypothetical protein
LIFQELKAKSKQNNRIWFSRKPKQARCQWPMPVILATWEAEIRRIVVQGQHRQGIHQTPSQPITGHSGMHLSEGCAEGWHREDHGSRPPWAKAFGRPHLIRKMLDVMAHSCHVP